ncbi:polysaccharide deacetylase family protein [Arsenicicoccus bolidensis]|uniref:Polysaccharide deacetylase family protein n=1 Tax=Arsenicicoccus bolidensis TaxID=229480 RepID=A0ABS9Q666_9MICO|nr:polysaccharide deacetylase family protein [Arsenicicoccus bolidensis]MCG7323372.1 polysaccharide deacetylase family protein [Arsenicicoccus bolidensis]
MDRSSSQGFRPLLCALAAAVLAAAVLVQLPVVTAGAATTPTVVTLTFDDGDADQLAAQRTMRSAGLAGTFYVVSGWVGAPGYLSRADLTAMAADGNEIGGHTVTHPDLVQIPAQEVRRQICNDRATLHQWGFRPVSFAYPFSDANPAVEQAAQDCGYTTARGLGDVRSPFGCTGCVRAETSPPPDPYYLRAPDQVDARWTLGTLKSQVTAASTRSGGWVILTFHRVCAPLGTADCPADRSVTPEVFGQFTTWLAAYARTASNNTTVRTVDQQVRAYLGAGYPAYSVPVPVPTTPPTQPGVNALTNPSLEAVDGFTGFPSCFQPGGWGTNTPSWARSTASRTGVAAEQLTMTGYQDGDAKLLPTLDLGTCSPSVVPGRTYEVSTWFTSTAVSQLALYYRDGSGAWRYWTSSPWIAAAPTWQRAAFTTPPAPAGATGMSFGLALIASGVLTTDDYALTEVPATSPTATASARRLVVSAPSLGATPGRRPTRVRPAQATPQGTTTLRPTLRRQDAAATTYVPGPGEVPEGTRIAPAVALERR